MDVASGSSCGADKLDEMFRGCFTRNVHVNRPVEGSERPSYSSTVDLKQLLRPAFQQTSQQRQPAEAIRHNRPIRCLHHQWSQSTSMQKIFHPDLLSDDLDGCF